MFDWSSWFEFTIFDAIFLIIVFATFFYWLTKKETPWTIPPNLNPLPMKDMTVKELSRYNGSSNKRILLGLNGTIYDVSQGNQFYGPRKIYGKLAGHDATRALATMKDAAVSLKFDNHEDLTESQKVTVNEWESQFKFKYPTVGRLIRDTDKKANYGGNLSSVLGDRSLEEFVVANKKNK